MTTIATIQERYDGIEFGGLPKTLQDSITTTHRLGIQYIWIDSLCIVQDDSNEKAQDIAQMGEVYSQAYITLSASSAASVTEGFLQTRSIPQPLDPIALRYVNESGVEGTIIATSEPIPEVTHLWLPSSGTVDKRKARIEIYCAPSWSWATVDGEVECKLGVESTIPEPACEVLDVQVDLANDDAPFGAVVSGYIIIRGNTRRAVFYPLTSELFFHEPGTEEGDKERQTARYEGFVDCKPDEDTAAAENPSVNVCCLHIRNFGGRGEGLLLVEDVESHVFRRIGHFYWNLEDLGEPFEHAEKAEVKIV
ncbi:hypothetical protein LRP88_00365 [Fusarium phalaenopsidis]